MSISTGTGDRGETGLVGGARVPKDHLRIEAYGSVDELNAVVGMVRTSPGAAPLDDELSQISHWLFDLGTDLATPGAGLPGGAALRLEEAAALTLESWVHREEKNLPRLRNFILPGGTAAAALLHLARTVCRRAERRVVTLARETQEGKVAIIFLNRLSDLLFMYARKVNHEAGVSDVEWRPGKPREGKPGAGK